MQCANPKIFRLNSEHYTRKYTLFIPCGKCYACQCNSRAEWALRMRAEFDDKRNSCAFFLTMSYDDKFLPHVGYNYMEVCNYLSSRSISERNYWFSILDKQHASMFLESLKHWYRQYFEIPEYYVNKRTGEYSAVKKTGFSSVYRQNSLPRYYLTGEYGDISNRAHMHAIVLFPNEVHESDLKQFANFLWPYGNLKIESHLSPAARNYVAKHQVKDCLGTPFQQLVSPIFAFSSRFNGGIGRALKDDYIMKRIYLRSMETGDKSECYYENIQSSVVYKIAIPRFLKKCWHEELLNDLELGVLERESLKNAKKFLETCMIDQNELSLYTECCELLVQNNKDDYAHTRLCHHVYKFSKKYIIQDNERRALYKRKKINKKLDLLVRGSNYSHI